MLAALEVGRPKESSGNLMHRRLFLKPKTLGGAAALVAEGFAEPDELPAGVDVSLLRVGRPAMATVFEVLLPCDLPGAASAAQDALDRIDEVESQLTVYRDDSEVSQLNLRAASEAVVVEPALFDLLRRASDLTCGTGGAFDVATGALIKAWGFYRRQGRVPSVAERIAAMHRTGVRHVVLDADGKTVRYRREGLEINLGGIGKGYALDQAARRLRQRWGVASGLLHGGTSSALAVGTPAGHPRGWPVVLKHPHDAAARLGRVWLRDRGLATSAATYQFFEYNGRNLGHILDPRTGWPAEGTAQVTVLAPTAAEADALSTALFVLGPAGAREYCRTHPDVAAVVLPAEPGAGPVVFNLGPNEFEPLPPFEKLSWSAFRS